MLLSRHDIYAMAAHACHIIITNTEWQRSECLAVDDGGKHQQTSIGSHLDTEVIAAKFKQDLSAREGRLMAKIAVEQSIGRDRGRHLDGCIASPLTPLPHPAYEKISSRGSRCDTRQYPTVGESISRVHEDDIVAMSHPYAFVHRIIYAFVRLGDKCRDAPGIVLGHLHAVICRSSVDDNIFILGEVLREYAGYCLPQSICIVAVYSDHAKQHRYII